jgi:hypothetical protein
MPESDQNASVESLETAAEAPDVAASERLRAFEDEHFGEDAPRFAGQVERGHGSKHALMSPEGKAHHLALELAVTAEKALADAKAKVAEAEAGVATAEARVTAAGEAHATAKQKAEEKAAAKVAKEPVAA